MFLSGVIGHLPGEMRLPDGGIVPEALQALQNLRSVLQGQGLGLRHLVRCTVMLADMADWGAFNEVWREAFGDIPLPAGLEGLKRAIANAIGTAGGDEARELLRLDRMFAGDAA